MQLLEFKTLLDNLAAALTGEDAKLVSALSAALPERTGTVAAFLSAADTVAEGASPGPRIGDALPILERAEALVRSIAKQAVINDYQLLIDWAKERQRAPMAVIAQSAPPPTRRATRSTPVREEVVREHVERLGTARPGSQVFGDALDKLDADRRVRKQEMVAIAREIADPSLAASTQRAPALKRIRLPHDAYLDSAARSDAIGGARIPRP